MAKAIHVCDIAKELGVSSADVIHYAPKLGVNVRRAAARLTESQARRIREAAERGFLVRRSLRDAAMPSSTAPPSERFARCMCCDLGFTYSVDVKPAFCGTCEDHYQVEGEDTARALERALDHEARLRKWLEDAGTQTSKYRGQMKAALRSRDSWRRALIEVALAHEATAKGGCCCGAAEYPCVTRRHLESVNLGIAKRVEEVEGLSDAELEDFLYGDDEAIASFG
jgi:hypothetical protein